jgi:surface antigen
MRAPPVLPACLLAACLLAAACAERQAPAIPPEAVGAGLGATAGGLVGNEIGAGTGTAWAIGGGIVVGGLIGLLAGSQLSPNDHVFMERAALQALDAAPVGTEVPWRNPATGAEGSFTPVRDWQGKSGETCRDLRQSVAVADRAAAGEAAACRLPDGRWRIVG